MFNIDRKFWLLYIVWWCLCAATQFWYLQRYQLGGNITLCESVIGNAILALGGYITINTFRFYMPGRGKLLYNFAYVVVLTFICVMGHKLCMEFFFSEHTAYLYFLRQSQTLRYIFSFLLLSSFGIISWLYYYMTVQDELQHRRNETEALLREAELAKLRQQLQPHFLFNSLNSISALAGTHPQQARTMIQQLSDFLRGTLRKDDNTLITLSAELQHLQLYLDIEKVRFGHRLSTEVICDDVCSEKMLPPLILQPVLENAIKFGLYNTLEDVTITIYASYHAPHLVVEVTNPVDAKTDDTAPGTGFGIASITRRLYLIYGQYQLLHTAQHNGIFTTTIKIPQI